MAQNGASEDYINKTLGHVKDALQAATERGLYDGHLPKTKSRAKASERMPIYLQQSELADMYRADLPAGLARVRDAFLISAYTGVRFSDLPKIRMDAVTEWRGRKVIRLVMKKTGRETAIPAGKELIEILECHPDGIVFSIQYANRMLKKVALLAGIAPDRVVLVTTHTARRTFATLEYLMAVSNGRSYAPVMRALGHTSERTFFRYIRLSAFENAELLRAG